MIQEKSVIVPTHMMYELYLQRATKPQDLAALADREFADFVRLIQKFLPPQTDVAYNMVAPTIAFTAIETAIMRGTPANAEIVLDVRANTDVLYAGMFHSPGSMLRPTDALPENDEKIVNAGDFGSSDFYEKPFQRVLFELGFTRDEIMTQSLKLYSNPPILVGAFVHETPRGTENANLFIGEISGDPPNPNAKFCSVREILENPKALNLIEHHIGLIAQFAFRYATFYPILRMWDGW